MEMLCSAFPEKFAVYLLYCRKLKFEQQLDYTFLKQLFINLFIRKQFPDDELYDWSGKELVKAELSKDKDN